MYIYLIEKKGIIGKRKLKKLKVNDLFVFKKILYKIDQINKEAKLIVVHIPRIVIEQGESINE